MLLQTLQDVFWVVAGFILSLRYRVRVKGLETVRGLRGPVLVLPNHPAFVDPALVLKSIWNVLRPRPLVVATFFENPLFRPVLKLLGAEPIADVELASQQARSQAGQAVEGVIAGLRAGRNHILWPSGRVQRRNFESLGGARGLAEILRSVPDAHVVLVRTRGLWGSSFSYAYTGDKPEFLSALLAGVRVLLANLLFFTPRRDVEVTVELVDRAKMPPPEREVINPWVQDWFNAPGPEQAAFVPYHFLFGARTHEYPKDSSLIEVDLTRVKPATKKVVAELLAEKLKRPLEPSEQDPDRPIDEFGLDSLDRMELALQIEHRFGFSSDVVPTTLGQFWALADGLLDKGAPKPAPAHWFRPHTGGNEPKILADNIPEAFLARALSCRKDVAVADDTAGALTYERLLVGARTMARRFRQIQAPNVGLMLPSAVAADVAFMGLQLAGKLPVMLNWTTGPANLAHAARLMGLTHVVTSRRFIDRAGIVVDGVEYLYLESVREGIGKFELLRTLLGGRMFPGRIMASVPKPDPNSPAVVLFTSGSEKAPKAVPLTHANILSNQVHGLPALGFQRDDVVLGFLPMFHSFGMNVTGLLPVLAGMKVVRHPDPTDAGGLLRKVREYKPTLLCGTPTFVGYIVDRAKPGDLDSLRQVIVGAEKCPAPLFEKVAALSPMTRIFEGYGITECSPVVSSNTVHASKPGTIGRPLPAVEVRVVDLEHERPVPAGTTGMLWVAGPTIFPGYLGWEGEQPFRTVDGKRWYVTGDLCELDPDGFIVFRGRLKRFLKAGGEMISLPALEEPFTKLLPPTQDGPRAAIEGLEADGDHPRKIVLFTTEDLDIKRANAILWDAGHRGVMRLDEVRRVEKLPVLGTGKTDYKVLRAMVRGA